MEQAASLEKLQLDYCLDRKRRRHVVVPYLSSCFSPAYSLYCPYSILVFSVSRGLFVLVKPHSFVLGKHGNAPNAIFVALARPRSSAPPVHGLCGPCRWSLCLTGISSKPGAKRPASKTNRVLDQSGKHTQGVYKLPGAATERTLHPSLLSPRSLVPAPALVLVLAVRAALRPRLPLINLLRFTHSLTRLDASFP